MNNTRLTPPIDGESLEQKAIALAYAQAMQQMEDKTASAQVVTHFLKLGSRRAEVEVKKIELDTLLVQERIASEQSGQKLQEQFSEVLRAIRSYSGMGEQEGHDSDIF